MLQTLCAQPRLLFQSIILAFGADLGGSTLSQDSAALAFPSIMFGFAWSIEMVRVYVKDQVGSLPSLFVHGRCWLLVVGCGEVDVGGTRSRIAARSRLGSLKALCLTMNFSLKRRKPYSLS